MPIVLLVIAAFSVRSKTCRWSVAILLSDFIVSSRSALERF